MHIIPDFDEKIKIEDFSLSWRWDENHNHLIETSELEKIIPFSEMESKRINKIIEYYEDEVNLRKNFNETDRIIANSDNEVNIEKFRKEFLNLTIDYNENVIISWNCSDCVYTKKNIFIKYWDDFCYPSSDDVTVISELTNWVFFYSHYEVGKFWDKIKKNTNT